MHAFSAEHSNRGNTVDTLSHWSAGKSRTSALVFVRRNLFRCPMNLQLNHLNSKAAATTPMVVEALNQLVSEGCIDAAQFATMQVQLDWVQYKTNFREVVQVTKLGRERDDNPVL